MWTMTSAPAPRQPLRQLKALLLTLCLLLPLALLPGCASSKNANFTVEPTPQPPAFLSGPMALLLTNVDGFRAHVTLANASPTGQPVSGDLMGKSGKLFFAPAPAKKKSKRVSAADSAFIWNVSANRGYVLNDPLQAYAPCSSSLEFTNVAAGPATAPSAPETISGHSCQPSEVLVTATDGSITGFRLWRAPDLKGLPLRIVCTSGGMPMTLTLSKPHLEKLPDDLFLPPSDFAKYDSGESMVNEMVSRQHNLKRRPAYTIPEEEPGAGGDARFPTRPQ
jgi:hypothetical protein